ncbi:MAG TPA: FlgD immunoglobulin-like domain containing protein, partial [bacterium]|nr:FlgD immunoglobulin-like domain containing protein [bacterium]
GDTTIHLSWIRPGDADRAGTLVVRSESPVTWMPSDGATYAPGAEPSPGVFVVAADDVDHSGTPFEDTPLAPGTEFHYALFAYDEVPNYSPGVGDAATTTADAVDAPVTATAPREPSFRVTGRHPVRERAEFRLELPATAAVEVTVHDVTGRRVATLVRGERTAGSHRLDWDGRGPDGRRATAGIYFVRVRTAGLFDTHKVVLLR